MSGKNKRKTVIGKKGDTPPQMPATGASAELCGLPADRRVWLPICAFVLLASAWLLFFRLGHYPLWDDEVQTAWYGRGIARTGDTLALLDDNLYAYRGGSQLIDLHGRYIPPASFYFAAPFVGRSGTSSLWPRVPFAFCGWLSVAFMLYWMWRSRLSAAAWIVISIGLLANVSFFLYCRQSRYYSMTVLLSLVIVYLYLNWYGRNSRIVWMMLASILLMFTQYLAYAGLYAVLACDYLLFARRRQRLGAGRLLLLLGPQLFMGIIAIWFYNPLGAHTVDIAGRNILLDKLNLLWWNFRDLDQCEFCVGAVLLAAPIVFLWTRNVWLLRGVVALISYVVVTVILSPQPVAITMVADVRYLMALIPLCVGLAALVIVSLTRHQILVASLLAAAVFGSNVLSHPFSPDRWRCRAAEFGLELYSARTTPISEAVKWIDERVKEGESVWVMPDHMRYPLMYHAPQAVYAWQLSDPPQEQFADLPPIHIFGRIPPDYFIIFGPIKVEVEKLIKNMNTQGVDYRIVEVLEIYWDELTRPEIFWRSFKPVKNFNRQFQAVYVYRRVK